LATWESDDGAPKVDYNKSDFKNNIVVLTQRPPVCLRPERNVPKTKYMPVDEPGAARRGKAEREAQDTSEDSSSEEGEEEEVAPRKKARQQQRSKQKGESSAKDRDEEEVAVRKKARKQHRSRKSVESTTDPREEVKSSLKMHPQSLRPTLRILQNGSGLPGVKSKKKVMN
jgi:hypothetical protein